jgi:FAD synthase
MSDVTRIIEAAQQGDPTAADQLLPSNYIAAGSVQNGSLANAARV